MAEEDQEEGSVWQELQVLQSIYLEELAVSQEDRVELSITLHPATGDDAESQYVCLTLQLSLPPQYPDEPPKISVSNPRGLCDEQIHSITEILHATAVQSVGGPHLYELIEKGKEILTASNIPRGHCVICLYGFQEGDSLTKTQCFHHFHSNCLGRYAMHCLEQKTEEDDLVLCPVCRESVTCDFKKLEEAPPPQQPEEWYVPDTCTLQREKDLRQIYERQLANGGIIDVEAERNRFFIRIQETPASDHAINVPNEEQESAQEAVPKSQEEHTQQAVTKSHEDTTQQAVPTSQEEHTQQAVPTSHKEPAQQAVPASPEEHAQQACPTSPEERAPLPVNSKQHRGGIRAKVQPGQREHREGQHWRGGRGWTGRPRFDTRRVWRDEVGHRDFQPQTRGRGKTRGFHANGTVQAPMRGGSDRVLEEKHAPA